MVGSRESEERVEERARREEKRREGDPLEEVRRQTFSKTENAFSEMFTLFSGEGGNCKDDGREAGEAAAAESAL